MQMLGFGLGGMLGTHWSGAALAATGFAQPDLIVYNARVYTVDDKQPTAQAFAVKNGRFVAVGTNDEIRGFAGHATRLASSA